jgi:type III secretion protein L
MANGAEGNGLPASPGQKILRAQEAALWLDGYRFLEETKAAYAAEYQRGYEEGKAAGAAEAAQIVNATVVKVDRYLASLDQQVAGLAVNIVRRVLGDLDPTELISMAAAHALSDFRREKTLTVTVHPEAAERVAASLDAYVRNSGLGITVNVEPDLTLRKDGCVLSSEFAVIDATVEAQINALASAISMAAVERRGANS